ncbi:uncharacterized protein LOC117168339 [Belonocnema kinseyi]|uniref:uncharacterized protein LOC117168339 n=1 Tax=Belonocnema kinseyi TaxID=2817044 RepID=UPI00143D5DAF|nr:uncharacterized protein LOC117168339 [Belonocnema kinseyi]
MEEVYVIRIKTKPIPSSLYPSERRYSASTVGGLAMIHFGLGVLALLLGSLARSLQGPILALACLVPFFSGLLAWRRWYIDRNIGLFFYGSLISLTVAVLCLAATIFEMTTIVQGDGGSSWSMEHIFTRYGSSATRNDSLYLGEDTSTNYSQHWNANEAYNRSAMQGFNLPFQAVDTLEDLVAEASVIHEKRMTENDNDNFNKSGSPEMMRIWHNERGSLHSKLLLAINVLVTSLLETLWSLLSARIGFRGMINRVETSYSGNATGKKEHKSGHKKKLPAPRPDILSHYQKNFGSLQSLNSLQSSLNSGPRLPLPESSREFRERVERFLVNQAAHRSVENAGP